MKFQAFASLIVMLAVSPVVFAQQFGDGLTPYQSFHGGDVDSVNLQNQNLVLHIPIASYPQRGAVKMDYVLTYNAQVQYTKTLNSPSDGPYEIYTKRYPLTFAAQVKDQDVLSWSDIFVNYGGGASSTFYLLTTADGAPHPLEPIATNVYRSADATGYLVDFNAHMFYDRHGTRYPDPQQLGSIRREDTNGNQITTSTDSVGRPITLPPAFPQNGNTDSSQCAGPLPIASAYLLSLPGTDSSAGRYQDTGGEYVLQSLVNMQDGSAWVFEYNDRDPGDTPSTNYGTLTKVTFPTGGSISYVYSWGGPPAQQYGDALIRRVYSRTMDANDGNGPHTWTYNQVPITGTLAVVTTVTGPATDTSPAGDDVVHTFRMSCPGSSAVTGDYETEADYFQGTGSSRRLLRKQSTSYTCQNSPGLPFPTFYSLNVIPKTTTTTVDNGSSTTETKTYDNVGGYTVNGVVLNYGNVTDDTITGYGGELIQQTHTAYQAFSDANYLNANLLDRVNLVQISDQNASPASSTSFYYDQNLSVSAPCSAPAGGTYPNSSGPVTIRGNLSTVLKWLNTGGSINSTTVYDSVGQPVQMTDAGGHPTCLSYDSTDTFVTSRKNALGHITQYGWDTNTGLLTSITDPNQQTTSADYYPTWKLHHLNYPDGGQSTFDYPSITQLHRAIKQGGTTPDMQFWVNFDGFGRQHTTETLDPEGDDFTRTEYDALGRVWKAYNPYRTTSSPTDGYTQHDYDALGRETTLTRPDGNTVQTDYSAFPTVTVTDETGRHRQNTTDALGRIVQVIEANPTTGSMTTDTMPTYYTYDALGNVTQVNQLGDWTAPRVRTFTYDSLSRLLTANNPESGTTSYGYDANGNLTAKTDARGITISMGYDALNRIQSRIASDWSSARYWAYDENLKWNGNAPLTNGIGRVTSDYGAATNGRYSQSLYSYDPTGRLTWKPTCLPDDCGPNGANDGWHATYDLAGHLATLTYPDGRQLIYGYSAAGRLANVAQVSVAPAYLNVTSTWPTGAWSTAKFGNGTQESDAYSNRLQPVDRTLFAPNGVAKLADRQYLWRGCATGNGTGDNGNVCGINDLVNPAHNQTFDYEQLNRIRLAVQADNAFNQTFGYDPWGNLSQWGTWSFLPSYASNNRIASFGVSYDAAGNIKTDQLGQTYNYDGEEQILNSSSGGAYAYDADGERARKDATGAWTEYVKFQGNTIAEKNSDGTWTDYIFGEGKRIAQFDHGSPSATYHWTDHLGSISVVTDNNGAIRWQGTFAPFGQPASSTGTNPTHYLFTGKERDRESNLDYFGARYFSSTMGRWMSPDWSDKPEPVPYADLSDPQSLNLYGYVANNPLSDRDADGHHQECGTDTSSTDKDGTVTVYAHCVEIPDFSFAAALGHHFLQRAILRNLPRNSMAYRFFNKWTTGRLLNPGVHRGFSSGHRAYSRAVERLVRRLEEDFGRSMREWDESNIGDAVREFRETGEADIKDFLSDIATDNPAARTVVEEIEPIINALRTGELGQAAGRIATQAGEAVDATAEACAEGGCIP